MPLGTGREPPRVKRVAVELLLCAPSADVGRLLAEQYLRHASHAAYAVVGGTALVY